MNTFPLTVASPDGNLFHGEAVQLTLRGSEGDLAVLAGHIPFITAVKPGACRILLPDGTEDRRRPADRRRRPRDAAVRELPLGRVKWFYEKTPLHRIR